MSKASRNLENADYCVAGGPLHSNIGLFKSGSIQSTFEFQISTDRAPPIENRGPTWRNDDSKFRPSSGVLDHALSTEMIAANLLPSGYQRNRSKNSWEFAGSGCGNLLENCVLCPAYYVRVRGDWGSWRSRSRADSRRDEASCALVNCYFLPTATIRSIAED